MCWIKVKFIPVWEGLAPSLPSPWSPALHRPLSVGRLGHAELFNLALQDAFFGLPKRLWRFPKRLRLHFFAQMKPTLRVAKQSLVCFALWTPPSNDFWRSWVDFLLPEGQSLAICWCFSALAGRLARRRGDARKTSKNVVRSLRNQGFAFTRMLKKLMENPSRRASRPRRATDRV